VVSTSSGASSPLTLVSSAVAGHDLLRIAASAHEALGRPVAMAIPSLGEPFVWPPGSIDTAAVAAVSEYATDLIREAEPQAPADVAAAVTVRIGDEAVGAVAVTGPVESAGPTRPWLEAAAEAAAVAVLMRETREGGLEDSRRALLQALRAGAPTDVPAILDRATRLGFDLGSGAVGVCAAYGSADGLTTRHAALIADVGGGKVCALVPLASGLPDGTAESLAAELAERGLDVALSTPRRDPALLHEALREAELLVELAAAEGESFDRLQDTYRLLIGVMLRDPHELERLRAQTISPLVIYDQEHETELVATLRAFLSHDGSTTDTAESMQLHRHTVGYRLARVQEVSGLSPYESDGRERLGLGLKAHHIINAAERLHP
jgi:hypothetical protein